MLLWPFAFINCERYLRVSCSHLCQSLVLGRCWTHKINKGTLFCPLIAECLCAFVPSLDAQENLPLKLSGPRILFVFWISTTKSDPLTDTGLFEGTFSARRFVSLQVLAHSICIVDLPAPWQSQQPQLQLLMSPGPIGKPPSTLAPATQALAPVPCSFLTEFIKCTDLKKIDVSSIDFSLPSPCFLVNWVWRFILFLLFFFLVL